MKENKIESKFLMEQAVFRYPKAKQRLEVLVEVFQFPLL